MIRNFAGRAKSTTRTRLSAVVEGLQLPFDWTIEEFVEAVTEVRGRPIVLAPMPDVVVAGRRVCGLWFARATDDLVLHRVSADQDHQKQIIAHEVSHILLEHAEDASLDPVPLATALSGIDPSTMELGTAVRARGFSDYHENGEYEAELMARMIVTRASRATRQAGERLRDRGLRLF